MNAKKQCSGTVSSEATPG